MMLNARRRPLLLSTLAGLALLGAACAGPASQGPLVQINVPTQALTRSTSSGDGSIIEVVQRVRPSVVNISTNGVQQGLGGIEQGGGTGTGFIIRADGVVVTNYHVVEGAQQIMVTTSGPKVRRYPARVIGGDAQADLAVLKIEASGLPTVEMGTSGDLQLGQEVIAIGYALALEGGPSVTTGIVSALDRTIEASDPNCEECEDGSRTYSSIVQTDAAINPGNSGGPLVDLQGRVIGINSAGAGAAQADNIGFAIAIDAAKPTIDHAVANPSAPRPFVGVVTQGITDQLAFQFDLSVQKGLYVVQTAKGGRAEEAGIESGDVMTSFAGMQISTTDEFATAIDRNEPGDEVEIELVKMDGTQETITLVLGVNPLP